MKDAGKEICSFLEKKLSLFATYLSITKRMGKAVRDKEAINAEVFISERQNCIHKIEKIDSSIENIINTSADNLHHISDNFKELIQRHLSSIKNIMKTVDFIEKESMITLKEEGEGIKKELMRMRNFQQAARGYKKEKGYTPRFLDTTR